MARIPHRQAVFFELDGVVLERPRIGSDGQVSYHRGALQALARINPVQFLLFVATNREDIAFGKLSDREFRKVCDRFVQDAAELGVRIAKIYSCPFHPKGRAKYRKESVFRKPAPGMFKIAQQEFDLNLARCWMIGHTTVDMLAASRAGMGTILVETGEGGRDGAFFVEPHFQVPGSAGSGRLHQHVREIPAGLAARSSRPAIEFCRPSLYGGEQRHAPHSGGPQHPCALPAVLPEVRTSSTSTTTRSRSPEARRTANASSTFGGARGHPRVALGHGVPDPPKRPGEVP